MCMINKLYMRRKSKAFILNELDGSPLFRLNYLTAPFCLSFFLNFSSFYDYHRNCELNQHGCLFGAEFPCQLCEYTFTGCCVAT